MVQEQISGIEESSFLFINSVGELLTHQNFLLISLSVLALELIIGLVYLKKRRLSIF